MNSKIRDIMFLVVIVLVVGVTAFITMYKTEKEQTDSIVGVHVKGEVKAPGYYELSYGSRVKDAVSIAGGATDDADLDSLNLAMKLFDGQEVEVAGLGKSENVTSTEVDSGKVNINTADIYSLCKLEGIGEKIAEDIVEYRTKKGAFKSVNELMKVKGIGKSKFNLIKDSIEV